VDGFNKIAPSYDTLNTLMTGGGHYYLRWLLCQEVLKYSHQNSFQNLLDISTGTGEILRTLLKFTSENSNLFKEVNAYDPSDSMLEIARNSLKEYPIYWINQWKDLKDNHYNHVTISWGLRNFPSWKEALKDIHSKIVPEGLLYICESFRPPGWLLKMNQIIVPTLGKIVSPYPEAYEYYVESIGEFPTYQEFQKEILNFGFKVESSQSFLWDSLGILTLRCHK
jgi:demethylmenaquinone methyltransferase / 2-methoxy-6-polyprenyl-1,4-benzoquinol methylase